jgi:hypothetical protein
MTEIDKLANLWQAHKSAEQYAIEQRRIVEAQLIELIGATDEGTTTQETDHFKVKTVGKLTRSIDGDLIQADWHHLPQAIKDCVKWKPQVDIKALRTLDSLHDDLQSQLAKYLTTKPAKTSIIIEIKE